MRISSKTVLSGVLLTSSSITISNIQAKDAPKKNILFIVVDDLKPLLGCYGDTIVKSPNIDLLASRGVIFTHSYCQQAVSAATRASLLTGKCPDYTQVWDEHTHIRDKNPDIMTLPEYLISNGYTTAGIGKVFDPGSVDKNQDNVSWSVPYIEYEKYLDNSTGEIMLGNYRNPALRNDVEKMEKEGLEKGLKGYKLEKYIRKKINPSTECISINDGAYSDGAIAKGAIDFLDKYDGNKPFFLAVGFKKPHLPFVAPKKYWDLYDESKMPLAEYRQKALNSPDFAYHKSPELRNYTDIPPLASFSDIQNTILPDEKARQLIHGYYSCVSYVDAQIGKVIAELDKKGLTKNTIIVLWGDHGWHLGDHGLWTKHTNFEQATHTVFILIDPSQNKHMEIASQVEFLDIFPTLCDLSGLNIPKNLDGKSLKSLLSNPEGKVKDYSVSQFPRGPIMGYSIRTERYRYTVWVGWKNRQLDINNVIATELYDYAKDPLEKVNVVGEAEYKNVLATMKNYFEDFKTKRIGKAVVVTNPVATTKAKNKKKNAFKEE